MNPTDSSQKCTAQHQQQQQVTVVFQTQPPQFVPPLAHSAPLPVHFISPTSSATSCLSTQSHSCGGSFATTGANSDHSNPKRGRDDSDSHSESGNSFQAAAVAPPPVAQSHQQLHEQQQQQQQQQPAAAMKRTRANNYIAPKQVAKNSLLASMGSLAVPAAAAGFGGNNNDPAGRRVQFRRQLSGSKLESFIGNHDSMDVDKDESRPRSMSF